RRHGGGAAAGRQTARGAAGEGHHHRRGDHSRARAEADRVGRREQDPSEAHLGRAAAALLGPHRASDVEGTILITVSGTGVAAASLTLAALAVVVTCIGASLRRLYFAIVPTALDPVPLVKELTGEKGRARHREVCAAIAEVPGADWERDVVAALA